MMLGCSGPACADGIPFDVKTGKVTTAHVMIELSDSQREEIIALGSITLDSAQWADSRKLNPAVPKRIEMVFPRDWADCSCGAENVAYAIHTEPGRAAIIADFMEGDPASLLKERLGESGGAFLSVDPRGQFYHEGRLVPFAMLLKALEIQAKPAKNQVAPPDPCISIDIPFELEPSSAVLKPRLDEASAVAAKAGWEVLIH